MATQLQATADTRRARRRFTVNEYHRMIDTGILGKYDKVELVGGEVVEMSAMNARHAAAVRQLDKRLHTALEGLASIGVQLPVTIPEYDEPEPDIVVARFREDEYATAHPTPADVLLLIEVSESTFGHGSVMKLGIYARAGIPESWIVNLTRRGDAIERHTDPDSETGRYRTVVRFGRGEAITSTVLPKLSLPVDEVLGPRT